MQMEGGLLFRGPFCIYNNSIANEKTCNFVATLATFTLEV